MLPSLSLSLVPFRAGNAHRPPRLSSSGFSSSPSVRSPLSLRSVPFRRVRPCFHPRAQPRSRAIVAASEAAWTQQHPRPHVAMFSDTATGWPRDAGKMLVERRSGRATERPIGLNNSLPRRSPRITASPNDRCVRRTRLISPAKLERFRDQPRIRSFCVAD